ncbi:tubulin epsilon and delta complex protein 1-like [Ylistrum balloti]|uniref:tubulin epsilon and delta complex protein 1-like n=1 Tax=Ylistrum balloti TaxID=509963 RepID=UPI002905CF9A|nr:tubulin epsilon and delta complex protein 1-like [Ylistrum balloti]
MSQVRETIELLTKLLRRNGTSKIKAEVFRLAKFNNDEATVPFWKLLFELLYFLKYGVIDDVTVKAYAELTQEELAVYVKKSMQSRGFYSKEFSLLPNDMSSGSRELLLAFAWLMCKENVIVKFMEQCSSPVDENTLSVYEFDLEENIHSSNYLASSKFLNPVQRVQYLQLLNGKMRSSLKRLYSLQREKVKLDHKVHECTQGVSLSPGVSHLTALEVHMLKHPELLKKVFHLLEKDNERLQILLVWTEQEERFWKWMESVLDLKMQDMSVSGSQSASKMMYYNIPPDCVGSMESARIQLEEAIVKYESIIEQLEDVWESKRNTVTEQELDHLLTSINMEISLQRANLALDNTEQMLRTYKDPGLFYLRNTTSSSKKVSNLQVSGHPNDRSGHGDGPDSPTDIRSEIAVLEVQLKRLELETKRKQSHYCCDLDAIANSIPDSVCIQPKGYR